MALQGPFFGKRDEPTPARNPSPAPLGGTSSLGSAGAASAAQPFSAPVNAPAATPAPAPVADAPESGAKLTVGPNIKLKGVEITDCDTLLVEGMVEATVSSRVIQISETGAFKGSAEIDIAEVRGTFDGNLTVRQKLVIFSTGKVTGKIRYGKIVIEEGGQLSGDITFGTSGDKPATSGASGAKGEQLAVAA
ncbi:polymer-forming cytoskeletal protein [Ottowia sp.]|uniref:bactofilin family protein n=1 Tax=Ottowia sp. TaxID=1898956 RepID=UPI002C305C37|nr:polymer-forming cytoskeletal protein [Ottowia sp.]HOB66934.1 polymer-forming cytoskeletal protein [Ottowia sp.]HPZ58264.1 polymer-forming cytoskeletal protein [Ottowia sp.]HQD47932.1 polymer-forming cytoskeletal protein [Ottowia sp.]